MKRSWKHFCVCFLGVMLMGSAGAAQVEQELSFDSRPLAAGNSGWQLIHEALVVIPYGNSFSRDYLFDPALEATALKVTLTAPNGGACRATTSFLGLTFSARQDVYTVVYPDRDNVFSTPIGTVSWIRFHNYYTGILDIQCVRRLYARNDNPDNPPPPAAEFEFLGVLNYEGGFQTTGLDIDSPDKVTSLWIRVPDYCAELEILEAGTVTEGVFDRATRTEADGEWIFEVNGGAGSRVGAMKASLNGPRSLQCDIPVYVTMQP